MQIKVTACGICHSDLSMLDNEWGMSQYPLVGGHEVIGTVAATGSNVRSLRMGMTVGLGWHSAYCGECGSCLSGDQNLCAAAEGTIYQPKGCENCVQTGYRGRLGAVRDLRLRVLGDDDPHL